MFFFLGMLAVAVHSDLEIPNPLPKLFSLYLLIAIGFKGGHELYESFTDPKTDIAKIVVTLGVAVLMASVVPVYSFFILRLKLNDFNAAAIAATYGSISAVTFITASALLDKLNIDYGGHMVAALALMESPAIVVGLILVRVFGKKKLELGEDDTVTAESSWGAVLHEAFLNGSVLLLIGSVLVGVASGKEGWGKLHLFVEKDIFYGALMFFLLDMGLVAARRIRDLKQTGMFLIGFAILMPIGNAVLGILLAKLVGMGPGNGLLFSVLCASASYIAVPAAMRMTVPEANPSLYVSMALAITFPFNIIIGIPMYLQAIKLLGV